MLTVIAACGRNRITWAKATRDLWTEEDVAQYLQDRKRKSSKLDPSLNLPSWCSAARPEQPPKAAGQQGPA